MSILDFERDQLCPHIWDKSNKLKPGVKGFIYQSLEAFMVDNDIEGDKFFIHEIYIGSSLATYYYKEDSDLDIKVIINLEIFRKHNKAYSNWTDEEIIDFLIDNSRESNWTTAVVPGTLHILDFYFIPTYEFLDDRKIKYDSLYSITTNKWVKEPRKLDLEESPTFVLDKAKDKAADYIETIVNDMSKTKRDTIDFYILVDFLKTLDKDDIKEFEKVLYDYLERINNSVEKLIDDREVLKNLRRKTFNKKELDTQLEQLMNSLNYSDGNLVFKIVQRYGYLRILQEIKDLFKDKKITIDEVDDLKRTLDKF